MTSRDLPRVGVQVPRGSDEGLHTKVQTAYGKVPHPAYKKYPKMPLGFILVHYAGEVVYDMASFLEKNKVKPPPNPALTLTLPSP